MGLRPGTVLPSYTRADPFLAFSGKVGDVDDEYGLARVQDSSRAASISWSATGGPAGDGGWHYVGGAVGGDCDRTTQEASFALTADQTWVQMHIKVDANLSVATKPVIMVAVTKGDGANQASLKPVIKIDNTGQLYLGDSNGATNDTALGSPLTLGTEYIALLHATGAAAGSLTQEAFLHSATGALLASCTKAWAVGNAGSNDVGKWGNSGATSTVGLDYHFSHPIVWRNLSTNPGPCKVHTLRATGVVGAGNATAFGAADIPTAISENASTYRTGTLTTTAGSTQITSADLSFTQADVGARINNHAGITNSSRSIASVTNATTADLDSSTGITNQTAATCGVQRRGHDADTSYAVFNNATASTLELTMSDASIPATDQIHAVIVVGTMRHTGSGPTIQLGVKSGSTSELLPIFPTTSTNYNQRRGAASAASTAVSHSVNPATGLRWTSAEIDSLTGLIRDNDALLREFRITQFYILVVVAQVAASHSGSLRTIGAGVATAGVF